MWYIKLARGVMWILVFVIVLNYVLPLIFSNSLHLWMLIKRRKFMYIILNFIIISILVSSSSFTNLFLKLHKTTILESSYFKSNGYSNINKNNNDFSSSQQQSSSDYAENSWWCFTEMEEQDDKTMSFQVNGQQLHEFKEKKVQEHELEQEKYTEKKVEQQQLHGFQETKVDENLHEFSTGKKVEEQVYDFTNKKVEEKEEQEIEEEDDSLDATWRAIMESKGKESGPQLKKNSTWNGPNNGGGGGGGDHHESTTKKEKGGGLSRYRVAGLKKWQSYREVVERRESSRGNGGVVVVGGGGGGAKRGWRSMEVALTFHDELKKRADAFIARFTNDIRLQRLESDQRFLDMINRGL